MVKRADAILGVALFAVVYFVSSEYHMPGFRELDWLGYLLSAGACLPLAARRVAPFAVLVITVLAYSAYIAAGYLPSFNFWGPTLTFYTLAGMRSPRITACGAVLLAAVIAYSGLNAQGFTAVGVWAQAIVVPLAAWMLGNVSRRLAVATEQLRHEQEQRTAQALTDERLRIARELHDVVAHHLSVISMQAGLAEYVFDRDPVTAKGAVTTIGATTRETVEEMRHLLSLLRASETPDGPAPGLGELESLIDRVRATGLEVSLTVRGDTSDLPSGLQMTVYRVIQEALTNVLKHARECTAEVTVRRYAGRLSAQIVNSPPLAPVQAVGSGHGLIGMRERARIYGGTLVACPRADGGFNVELTVPLGGGALS